MISLGTWSHGGPNKSGETSVGWTRHDAAAARQSLIEAYEAGITHWDTADVYGDGRSEQMIGDVLGAEVPRDSIFLASKVGWDPGPHGHWYHPEWIRRRLEASLRHLGTEVIDLYYLHHCDFGPAGEYLDDALAELHKARDAGKIRFIGLSDWDATKIMRYIERVDPDVVQPYRNVTADTWADSGLKAWCEAHDVGVAFFSPIRHGLLLGKYEAPTTFDEGDFRRNDAGFQDADLLRALIANRDALIARLGAPEPVLRGLLGALLADAPTGCVLLGQRNARQVAAAARAGRRLSQPDAEFVWSLYRSLPNAAR